MKEALEQERDLSDMDHNRLYDAIFPDDVTEHADNVTEQADNVTEHAEEVNDIDEDEDVIENDAAEIFEQLERSNKKDAIAEISYEQGLKHLAGAIASKFRDDETLGKH